MVQVQKVKYPFVLRLSPSKLAPIHRTMKVSQCSNLHQQTLGNLDLRPVTCSSLVKFRSEVFMGSETLIR